MFSWFQSYLPLTQTEDSSAMEVETSIQSASTESAPIIPDEMSVDPPPVISHVPVDPIRIVILLDESGSMNTNRAETIKAINDFIQVQKREASDGCRFTLVTFDHTYRVIIDDVLLIDVNPLLDTQYIPNGCTGLYDAMGATMESLMGKKRVIFVIMTDGKENSSRKYSKHAIASLVKHYTNQDAFGWNIVYLAADPLLLDQGNELNIVHDESAGTVNCAVDFETLSAFTRLTLGSAVSEFRRGNSMTVNLKQSHSW